MVSKTFPKVEEITYESAICLQLVGPPLSCPQCYDACVAISNSLREYNFHLQTLWSLDFRTISFTKENPEWGKYIYINFK